MCLFGVVAFLLSKLLPLLVLPLGLALLLLLFGLIRRRSWPVGIAFLLLDAWKTGEGDKAGAEKSSEKQAQ